MVSEACCASKRTAISFRCPNRTATTPPPHHQKTTPGELLCVMLKGFNDGPKNPRERRIFQGALKPRNPKSEFQSPKNASFGHPEELAPRSMKKPQQSPLKCAKKHILDILIDFRDQFSRSPRRGAGNWCCAKFDDMCRKTCLTLLMILDVFCPARKLSTFVGNVLTLFDGHGPSKATCCQVFLKPPPPSNKGVQPAPKRPDVHKIVWSIKSGPPPPPPEKVSILRILYWFVQLLLILDPFRWGGGGRKTKFCGIEFMDTQTFLIS